MNTSSDLIESAFSFAIVFLVALLAAYPAYSAGLLPSPPSAGSLTEGLDHQDSDCTSPHRRTVGRTPCAAGRGGETWTLMFYNDADFSGYDPLQDFADDAFSGEHLNVLVLQDGFGDPAEVYHVGEDHTVTMLEEWGEVNMGNFTTLRDFIAFGKTNYPADRYILTVYDHGMAWEGACIDSTSYDWLIMDEFQRAFEEAGGVDIICFTAPCTMGALECVYELRDHVDLYVGSEATSGYILWRGIMGDICNILNTPPQPSIVEIGEEIIRLIEENNTTVYGEHMTLSAIRTDLLDNAVASLDRLSADLRTRMPGCLENLGLARGTAQHFNLGYWHGRSASSDVDIIDFAERFAAIESDPVLLQGLQDVVQNFEQVVVATTHGSRVNTANGLTLYFPCDGRYHDLRYNTFDLDFVDESGWDELLAAFYEHAPLRYLFTGPGPAEANTPLLRVFDAAAPESPLVEQTVYGVSSYGLNVVAGDLYGGSVPMVITGPGPGAVFGPHVRAFTPLGTPVPGVSFLAYGTQKYGVNVAAGNVDAALFDFDQDIVTGAGPGPVFGPHVRGWNFKLSGEIVPIPGLNFLAYGTNKYGVNVACGNINGGFQEEVVTGPGPGAVFGPHVRGWKYLEPEERVVPLPGLSFLAYGTSRYGVNVACGDLTGNQRDEIITAPGPGGLFPAHIRAWRWSVGEVTPLPGISFLAYPSSMYGARVSTADLDQDGIDEILTIPGPDPGWGARVLAWDVVADEVIPMVDFSFDAYADLGLTHGGSVAGGNY